MRLFRPRALASGALAASLAVGALFIGGSPAQAAGELPAAGLAMTISPASGNNFVSPTIRLSAPCAPGSTQYFALLYGGAAGSQMPADGQLMSNNPTPNPSTTTAFSFQTGFSFQATAEVAGGASATLSGTYVVEVNCTDDFSNVKNRFTAPVTFSSATAYTAPVPNIATATSLAASPASSQVEGGAVVLTAAVTPASGGAPAGTVEFFDGTTSLGSAATSGGSASISRSNLSVGSHSFTATFNGAGYNPSTSSAVSYTITAAPSKSSTTTLAVTPSGTAEQNQSVTLAATIAIAGGSPANGSVEFYDGAVKFATKQVIAGSASSTLSFSLVGVHTLKAVFAPTNAAVQLGSEDSEDLAITAPAGVTQNIEVSLAETGALTISVSDNTVVLPNFTLDAAADKLSSGGRINDVTVTDTRLYEQGWTASGQVANDFVSGSDSFSSTGLGWTPIVVSKPSPSTIITPGVAVAPFSNQGLKTAKVLASAPADEGRGTTVLNADLLLKAPTTTVPGTYNALLTLTVL